MVVTRIKKNLLCFKCAKYKSRSSKELNFLQLNNPVPSQNLKLELFCFFLTSISQ